MDKEIFLNKMREILDNDNVEFSTNLLDIEEWDSLSMFGYLSVATAASKNKITAQQVRDCGTINDLYNLMQ